jgi:hypothetical protein
MGFGQGCGEVTGLVDPVGELRSVADRVIAQDPADLTDAELGLDLVRLRRQIDRLEAAFSDRTLAANRRGVGLADGHRSTPAWLAWKAGMHRGAVNRSLRHAEVCELLPETGRAWRDGEITAAAVELIANARVPGADDALVAVEEEFLDRARRGDHRSLGVLTRHFALCARADGSAPAAPDGLSFVPVGDRHALRGEFGGGAAEIIAAALDAFTRPPQPDDPGTAASRRAEAMVRICEVATGRGADAEGARPVVNYLTQAATASDPAAPLTLGVLTGPVDPRERARILCDATISRVVADPAGLPLDVGRATPVWNRAMRRAVAARSPHCQWPGCDVPAPRCDLHHVEHWEHGGETCVANGCHLCRRHHTFLHQHGDWAVTFVGQVLRVFRPDGSEVFREPWAGLAA